MKMLLVEVAVCFYSSQFTSLWSNSTTSCKILRQFAFCCTTNLRDYYFALTAQQWPCWEFGGARFQMTSCRSRGGTIMLRRASSGNKGGLG